MEKGGQTVNDLTKVIACEKLKIPQLASTSLLIQRYEVIHSWSIPMARRWHAFRKKSTEEPGLN